MKKFILLTIAFLGLALSNYANVVDRSDYPGDEVTLSVHQEFTTDFQIIEIENTTSVAYHHSVEWNISELNLFTKNPNPNIFYQHRHRCKYEAIEGANVQIPNHKKFYKKRYLRRHTVATS